MTMANKFRKERIQEKINDYFGIRETMFYAFNDKSELKNSMTKSKEKQMK